MMGLGASLLKYAETKDARSGVKPSRTAICMWAACLTACGEPLFLLHEARAITVERELLIEQSCQAIEDEGGSSGSTGAGSGAVPDFSIDTRMFDEGAHVVVRGPTGGRLANRVYNEDFLESGRRDEFTVRLDAITSLRLIFRGADHCEFVDM